MLNPNEIVLMERWLTSAQNEGHDGGGELKVARFPNGELRRYTGHQKVPSPVQQPW